MRANLGVKEKPILSPAKDFYYLTFIIKPSTSFIMSVMSTHTILILKHDCSTII